MEEVIFNLAYLYAIEHIDLHKTQPNICKMFPNLSKVMIFRQCSKAYVKRVSELNQCLASK